MRHYLILKGTEFICVKKSLSRASRRNYYSHPSYKNKGKINIYTENLLCYGILLTQLLYLSLCAYVSLIFTQEQWYYEKKPVGQMFWKMSKINFIYMHEHLWPIVLSAISSGISHFKNPLKLFDKHTFPYQCWNISN